MRADVLFMHAEQRSVHADVLFVHADVRFVHATCFLYTRTCFPCMRTSHPCTRMVTRARVFRGPVCNPYILNMVGYVIRARGRDVRARG